MLKKFKKKDFTGKSFIIVRTIKNWCYLKYSLRNVDNLMNFVIILLTVLHALKHLPLGIFQSLPHFRLFHKLL